MVIAPFTSCPLLQNILALHILYTTLLEVHLIYCAILYHPKVSLKSPAHSDIIKSLLLSREEIPRFSLFSRALVQIVSNFISFVKRASLEVTREG